MTQDKQDIIILMERMLAWKVSVNIAFLFLSSCPDYKVLLQGKNTTSTLICSQELGIIPTEGQSILGVLCNCNIRCWVGVELL